MRRVFHMALFPSLILAPALNAKPFGPGLPVPTAVAAPAWMIGDFLPNRMTAGLVNADAIPDLIGISHAGDKLFWVDLSLETPVVHPISDNARGPSALCVIDADFDNDLDLVVSSRWDTKLTLFTHQGSGTFNTGTTIATGIDTAVDLHTMDMDGDSIPDLVGISDFNREIFWLKHQSNGSFGPKQIIATTAGQPLQLEVTALGTAATPSLAVLDSANGSVLVFSKTSNGEFDLTSQLGAGLTGFAVGDFNGDALPDLVTHSSVLGTCSAYQGTPAGNFASPIHIAADLNGAEITAQGDLDLDGKPDLLLASHANDQILWLRNDGSFSFTKSIAAPSPSGPSLAVLTDVDGDSAADLVQASLYGETLALHPSYGANPYAFWIDDFGLDPGSNPPTADANGDGVTNLMAYASNLAPDGSGSATALVPETGTAGLPAFISPPSSGQFGIEFVRLSQTANSGLEYSILSSSDLTEWAQVDLKNATVTPIDSSWERVRFLTPRLPGGTGFLRMKVDYVQP